MHAYIIDFLISFVDTRVTSEMNLYEAIRDNDARKVKSIIRKNNNIINNTREYGSPLLLSAECGFTEILKILLKHGANPNAADSNGWTPLISACHFNHLDSVMVLLESNCNPNVQCLLGNSALHAAARNDNIKIMQALVQCGVNINSINVDGWTALHRAAYSNKMTAVQYLIDQGADTSIKSKSGRTPYDTALHMRLYDLAQLLRKYQVTGQRGEAESQETDSHNNIAAKTSSSIQARYEEFKIFAKRLLNSPKSTKSEPVEQGNNSRTNVREGDTTTLEDSTEEGVTNECPICFEIPLPTNIHLPMYERSYILWQMQNKTKHGQMSSMWYRYLWNGKSK